MDPLRKVTIINIHVNKTHSLVVIQKKTGASEA